MSLVTSLFIPKIYAVLNLRDIIIIISNDILQICLIVKQIKKVLVFRIVFKDVKQYKNIMLPRDLIQDYNLVSSSYKIHGKESIKELVMTRRCKVINTSEIKDVAYIFNANKIESGIYSICGKSNAFILRYCYYKYNRIQVFIDISD